MDVAVDWVKLVQLQVPQWMRRKRMVVWLLVCISQVRALHASFLSYRERSLYSLRITGQTISLEKALNDRFDFVNRLIWIETATDLSQFYLYNKIEYSVPVPPLPPAPKVYFYNKYNAAHPYAMEEYATGHGHVWKALVATPANPPGVDPAEWSDEGEQLYLKNKAEAQVVNDFIIWVPVGLVYDVDELRALVAIYKLAGKRYIIMTY